jgi:hypothetical protein
VAALMLEFFKDLPDPLFPYALHKGFVSWIGIMKVNAYLVCFRH